MGDKSQTWSINLRNVADKSRVLNHAFLQGLAELDNAAIRAPLERWARQDYFVSMKFPRLLGILIGQIDQPEIRQPLVENLWEEQGEGDISSAHHNLFRRLLGGMGLPSEIDAKEESIATQRYIEMQEEVCRNDLLAGLGLFCYANEYITVDEFLPIERAVGQQYPEADLAYFVANRCVDARHADQTENVISALVRSSYDIRRVEKGALEGLEARAKFYDALTASSA